MNAEYPPKCDDCGPDGFHAADCFYRGTFATTSTICARCSTQLEVTDATADAVVREHEVRCFVVGDRVKCPTTPPADGIILSLEVNGLALVGMAPDTTNPGGFKKGDWLVFALSDLRRIPRPDHEAKPKWRQFKVDWSAMNEDSTPKDWRREYLGEWAAPDDRADAMEYGRRAIAEQHAKRVDYLAAPTRPPLTEHLKRAVVDGKAGPSMIGEIPARHTRPDGFEQSRIDMLKAAMLAPSVKVKR